ncbi:DUF3052 family protein [Chitinophagaceae bacterium MMS25-I14]
MPGYSPNPLSKKLGLNEGFAVRLINPPANYKELVGEVYDSLVVKHSAGTELDFIHFFANSPAELEKELPLLMRQIKKNGIIWVSWYKKSSKKPTELTENIIRDTALATGLVDVKVCAVDDDWSGLKLVYRLKDR